MRRFVTPAPVVIILLAVFSFEGCKKSENEALEAYLKQSGLSRDLIYPLAGKVTLDGETPHFVRPDRLVIMLTDVSSPNHLRRYSRQCTDDGEFAFGTFTKGDGLPAGTYVATFAVLKVTMQGLVGPDQLKNLYNDPDKNALLPEFKIVHQAPGKKDYLFDLKVAGQEGTETPGPNALTELRPQGK
jgi:hypothetical protein